MKKIAMTTEIKKKLNKNTVANLQSTNANLVNATINELSETGNASYVPMLIELLHSTSDNETKHQINKLLGELKHSDAIPMIVDAIRDSHYSDELQGLLEACWQNGLDYSKHLATFIDLVIENEFMIAFEAHTVIMNMTQPIAPAASATEMQKLKEAVLNADENKRSLMFDIIELLPRLEKGIQ